MHEGGGRWVSSNKLVELKKKKKSQRCLGATGAGTSWNEECRQVRPEDLDPSALSGNDKGRPWVADLGSTVQSHVLVCMTCLCLSLSHVQLFVTP